MKGQLSAEMLILIAVIIAVVAIASTRLITTAQDSSEQIDNQSDRMLEKSAEAVKGDRGDFCIDKDDCMDGLGCNNRKCG